jgi:hypothetical protein
MRKCLDNIGFGLSGLSMILLGMVCLCSMYGWNSLEKFCITGTIISFILSMILLMYSMLTNK